MRITMLGCGNSAGVPMIGCNCKVCKSTNPKNKRSRVSVLVEADGKNILIDTSPDLRQQALTNNIRRLDAVLFTHDHADHTHGIDDLRSFNYLSNADIPVYADATTLESVTTRFAYAFQGRPQASWARPSLKPQTIPAGNVVSFSVLGVECTAFAQIHGKTTSLGFRIGDFAYSTDVDKLPEESLAALKGVKVWIVDCLKYDPSYSHSHLEQTVKWVRQVGPKRAILTHMTHDLDYDTLASQLPDGMEPGYDGLIVDL